MIGSVDPRGQATVHPFSAIGMASHLQAQPVRLVDDRVDFCWLCYFRYFGGTGRKSALHRYFRFFLSLFFSTPPNEFFQIQAYLFTGFDCWLCYFHYFPDFNSEIASSAQPIRTLCEIRARLIAIA